MDPCLHLCELIKNVASRCEKRMNAALDELDVSHCQAQVLMKISAQGSISMTALSKELCCHKSNVTQIVDLLTERSLIERVPSKEDKRVFTLKLKPKGRALLATAETALCKQAGRSMDGFSAAEKKQFETLMKKYVLANAD